MCFIKDLAISSDQSKAEVVALLLDQYPGAAIVASEDGSLPHHAAIEARLSHSTIIKLLNLYPDGVYELPAGNVSLSQETVTLLEQLKNRCRLLLLLSLSIGLVGFTVGTVWCCRCKVPCTIFGLCMSVTGKDTTCSATRKLSTGCLAPTFVARATFPHTVPLSTAGMQRGNSPVAHCRAATLAIPS